ncbi:hypothetical protein BN128_689 [Cronobacter sakazakii 696]|nr:hypothetical protein BN128_689 [Cronobacter sakazakii 696]
MIFHLQRFIEACHDEENDEAERQAHDNCRVLQRRDAVGHQHPHRQHADGDRPENTQPVGSVAVNVFQLRGEVRKHQRAGIGGRHIKQHAGDGRDRRAQFKRRILCQQAVKAAFGMGDNFLRKACVAVNDLIQRRVAEHREPQQRKGKRNNQRAEHELTNGAPARNARQEQPDKRRPRHPPGPEEERPAVHPLARHVKSEGIERHPHKTVDVIANIEHQRVQQEIRFPHKQHKQDKPQRQNNVQFRKKTDAFIDARCHRNGGDNHRQHNQRDLRRQPFRDIKQHFQAVVKLHHADAKRRRDAKNGADHRRDINGVADRSVNALAENRVQRGANGQRQVIAIAKVAKRNTHQRVH